MYIYLLTGEQYVKGMIQNVTQARRHENTNIVITEVMETPARHLLVRQLELLEFKERITPGVRRME